MQKIIIINEIVVFEPDKNRLTPLTNFPSGSITLHAPVSACLFLLLQNNHQPVTQKFLLSEVWEKNGTIVTTNAIYQSIALIRKSLRAAGLDEELIITLPKIGFKADALLKILSVSEFRDTVLSEADNSQPIESTPTTAQHSTSLHKFFYLAGGVILLMLTFWWYLQPDAHSIYYTYTGNIHGCEVYSSWSGKEISTSIFNQFYLNHTLSCSPAKTIYITLNKSQSGTSILICKAHINSPQARCKSIFLMEKYND